jgi:Protein of unknown function (DUF3047)
LRNRWATVLRADSNAVASGRYREINFNLEKTPILNWTWETDNVLTGIDELTHAGDDDAARVYGVFWRTHILACPFYQLCMDKSNQPVGSS